MPDIKDHFEKQAQDYDDFILKIAPHYLNVLETLSAAIPFEKEKPFKLLDLGCGTGRTSQQIKESFPNAQITALDITENMSQIARARLKSHNVSFIIGDFCQTQWNDEFDAIVSSLALHHIREDEQKKDLFKKIFTSLNPGGIFINADVIKSSNSHLQNLNIERWKAYMRGRGVSDTEIENEWLPRHYEKDRPCPLIDELEWLKEAGFKTVDVIWKYFTIAIYCGIKD